MIGLKLEIFQVPHTATIRMAVEQMDAAGEGFVCIVGESKQVMGVMSNGDFRRAVLRGISLETPVTGIMNTHYKSLTVGYSQAEALELIQHTAADHIPVLDKGRMVGLVKASDFLPQEKSIHFKEGRHVPLVIMAGGQGTRLAPFTQVLPKPLMPIGERSVIEHILSSFESFGIKEAFIAIHHKARLIRAYCEELTSNCKINCVVEDKPLGTAGALHLMKDSLKTDFFMTNCDVIVKENFWEIYDFHQNKGFALTIIAAAKQHVVPYGVCHLNEKGLLTHIEEKPEINMLVSTGVYVVSPAILELIPAGRPLNMDELVTALCREGKKVGVFPVPEESFIDIGQMEEYKLAIQKISDEHYKG